jgi:hypothetical protein
VTGRIVETGTRGGRSTIARDDDIESVTLPTGRHLHRLWETDLLSWPGAVGGVVGAAANPPRPPYLAPNGARYWLLTLPAGLPADAELPFHSTPTLDLGAVLAGRVRLEMEDRTSAILGPGDTFVQNATAHRWHNAGACDAVIAVVVLGLSPAGTS